MHHNEIANLENASRAALAWVPEGYHGSNNFGVLFAAIVPAVSILAVAATLLLSII